MNSQVSFRMPEDYVLLMPWIFDHYCHIFCCEEPCKVYWLDDWQASGNVTLETVHKIGQTGVMYISR